MSLAPLDLFMLSCRSLGGNPLRSLLTTLGVFMGVAAVSATLQVGSISRIVIAQQLAARDAPRIAIGLRNLPGRYQSNRMSLEDLAFVWQQLPGLRAISGANGLGQGRAQFQNQEATPNLIAVTQDYLLTRGKPMNAGRFFTPADFANYRSVVVIDQLLAEQLFPQQSPVGQRLFARNRPYIVVGVMPTEITAEGTPPEGLILLPMSVSATLTGNQTIRWIQVRLQRLEDLPVIEKQLEALLGQRYPKRKFWKRNNVEDLLQQQQTLEFTSRSLAVVGLISLLVGGVGIANIMIASVAERTAEIGLRRALGATQTDIMLQFILEASLLSLLGGVVAIGAVHLLTLQVAEVFKLPYEFQSSTAVLALSSALIVGIGAGLPPALRASQLDPVKALRSD